MAGFLYYISGGGPDVKPSKVPYLRAILGDGHISRCPITGSGPDGKMGVVLADSRAVSRVGYYPDDQRWRRVPGHDGLYVGLVLSDPPTPGDLERERMLPGGHVTLADDRQWLCPMAMQRLIGDDVCPYMNALPKAATMNDAGEWEPGDTLPKYGHLWVLAEEFWSALMGVQFGTDESDPTTAILSFNNLMPAAVECLGANYRVGPAEVALAGLLNTQVAVEVMKVLTDYSTFISWLKKKRAAIESALQQTQDSAAS